VYSLVRGFSERKYRIDTRDAAPPPREISVAGCEGLDIYDNLDKQRNMVFYEGKRERGKGSSLAIQHFLPSSFALLSQCRDARSDTKATK